MKSDWIESLSRSASFTFCATLLSSCSLQESPQEMLEGAWVVVFDGAAEAEDEGYHAQIGTDRTISIYNQGDGVIASGTILRSNQEATHIQLENVEYECREVGSGDRDTRVYCGTVEYNFRGFLLVRTDL